MLSYSFRVFFHQTFNQALQNVQILILASQNFFESALRTGGKQNFELRLQIITLNPGQQCMCSRAQMAKKRYR
jgi:hypothetical protein